MTEPPDERTPRASSIPLLLFGAADIALAFFLLLDGGFTLHFWLVASIGLVLAGLGLSRVYWRTPE